MAASDLDGVGEVLTVLDGSTMVSRVRGLPRADAQVLILIETSSSADTLGMLCRESIEASLGCFVTRLSSPFSLDKPATFNAFLAITMIPVWIYRLLVG